MLLCDEAVKEEARRAGRQISKEEALERHTSFIETFRTATAAAGSDSGDDRLVVVMRQLLHRSIDSPHFVVIQSTPRSPRRKANDGNSKAAALSRSKSCFPTLVQ
ncbi:uncharacterized protein LOC120271533 [Dioscorea cayenensis subsp. rotundata]|uniref:Uncharacterized protein LOC120271533 n=1 Tax=Dioscorea cayennensis subsp. rotundata TaxID=55577 RepID=A0AB40C5K9_DIOCR|nr:uncharacterized protein LOC120271533 [Dioscorea cayenensis subsp. rotundata]